MAEGEDSGDIGAAERGRPHQSVEQARTAVVSYLTWKLRRTLALDELQSLNNRLDDLLAADRRSRDVQ